MSHRSGRIVLYRTMRFEITFKTAPVFVAFPVHLHLNQANSHPFRNL